MTEKLPTYYRVDTLGAVSEEEAYEAWFQVTIPFLKGIASTYQGYTTYTMYAEYLYEQTGIKTTRKLQRWPGEILGRALDVCEREEWPALSATVVNKVTGMCGDGFGKWQRESGLDTDDEFELEELASELRVQCYRRYALEVPEDFEKFHTPIHVQWLKDEERRARKRLAKLEREQQQLV